MTALYEDRAEICELLAEQTSDPRLANEWLLMAQDWRSAARQFDDTSVAES